MGQLFLEVVLLLTVVLYSIENYSLEHPGLGNIPKNFFLLFTQWANQISPIHDPVSLQRKSQSRFLCPQSLFKKWYQTHWKQLSEEIISLQLYIGCSNVVSPTPGVKFLESIPPCRGHPSKSKDEASFFGSVLTSFSAWRGQTALWSASQAEHPQSGASWKGQCDVPCCGTCT